MYKGETVTTETTVYDVSKLSKDSPIRENILDKQRNINVDGAWWYENEIDSWKELLVSMGFEDPKIIFSGFGSQGDGACFTTDSFNYVKGMVNTIKVDRPRFNDLHSIAYDIANIQKRYFYGLNGAITHKGRYSHEYSTTTEVMDRHDGWATDDIQKEFGECVVSLNKLIYKSIEEQYYALQEDECVLDTLEANEYKFTEDGSIFCE